MDTYNVKRYSDLKTIKCRNGGAYVCFQNNCLLKIGNYKYRIFYVSLMVITQVNLQYILKKKKKDKEKRIKAYHYRKSSNHKGREQDRKDRNKNYKTIRKQLKWQQ